MNYSVLAVILTLSSNILAMQKSDLIPPVTTPRGTFETALEIIEKIKRQNRTPAKAVEDKVVSDEDTGYTIS